MNNGEGKESHNDSNNFVGKFEAILHTLFEEYGKKPTTPKSLTEDQKSIARCLQELVSSGELKIDKAASETTSLCDGFIGEWESTGIKSAAVQQLIALLNRPHVRGVLISAEDISSNRYLPKLPSVPFEVDEDEGIVVKVVRIVKRDETLGATIRNDHGKIYIARLIAGGVAARSACIQEGDRILEVNGLPTSDLSIDDVARILNRVDKGTVTLKLVPAEMSMRADNGTPHVYLRALFDYKGKEDDRHPCPEVALSFKRGDILELLACNDDHWWQVNHFFSVFSISFIKNTTLKARRIGSGAFAHCEDMKASRIGLIPSEALQMTKSMSEIEQRPTDGRGSSRSGSSHESEYVYESVCRLSPRDGISRIIVLVGPPGVGRNELKRRLLSRYPQRFSTTVPHTTRPKRTGEVEGVDYYFTERSVMEKMIYSGQMLEFGEFRGNLYGTALCSVRDAQQAGIPLITPHPLALQLLRTHEFLPFIVFIQPPDAATFKNTRVVNASLPRGSSGQSRNASVTRMFSDAEIEQIINGGATLYKQYGHLFDAIIINKDLEESTTQLLHLISDVETKPTWVPLSWATNLCSE
ncbi:hypothetical protein Y032_0098g3133 [Ancylostoma ceylanicum]|uniref:PDZ/DHR/GLGF domain protein n=1 Tax=Ancylostoma ceylanicum TaxID=53326 RepID=A0A016TJC1_9BILA|nr:hypothetical protein Y032_0098g3133 [Ancylostoma ceylanicum]